MIKEESFYSKLKRNHPKKAQEFKEAWDDAIAWIDEFDKEVKNKK